MNVTAAVSATPSDLKALGRGQSAGDGFYVATLMFQRARQLRDGARPRIDSRGHTVARVAAMEVRGGFVIAAPYELVENR